MNRQDMVVAGSVLAGIAIGSASTYFVVSKRLEAKYARIAEDEIASVKESYDLLYKQGAYSDPKKAFEAMKDRVEELESYDDLLDSEGYFKDLDESDPPSLTEDVLEKVEARKPPLPDGRPDPETVLAEIIDDRTDPPRYEGEDTPYVITVNEFMQDNPEYDKTTVSYYEYDNTLASEDESIIPSHEEMLGGDFQNYIGWKSDSDHVVYVRNERLSTDFEILVHEGGYEEEVLGILPDDGPKKQMLNTRNNE